MPDLKANNPFTMVYNALWQMVENHPGIDEIVTLGNRINFDDDDREPLKQAVAAADVPELILTQESGVLRMHSSSHTSHVTKRYAWLISTGDFRINHFLNDVEWALFVAHIGWNTTVTSLKYNGNSFVKRAEVTDVTSGIADRQRNRGLQGWSSIWTLELEMHFKTADLRAELNP